MVFLLAPPATPADSAQLAASLGNQLITGARFGAGGWPLPLVGAMVRAASNSPRFRRLDLSGTDLSRTFREGWVTVTMAVNFLVGFYGGPAQLTHLDMRNCNLPGTMPQQLVQRAAPNVVVRV